MTGTAGRGDADVGVHGGHCPVVAVLQRLGDRDAGARGHRVGFRDRARVEIEETRTTSWVTGALEGARARVKFAQLGRSPGRGGLDHRRRPG